MWSVGAIIGLLIAGIVLGWIGVGILVIVLLSIATRGFS